MCGEKKVMRGAKDKRMGSPPHVRGKAGRRTSCTGIQRITPACAGKSPLRLFDRLYCSGSPPHVRGKASNAFIRPYGDRITPACAGKRRTQSMKRSPSGDHPRMCGEKYEITGTGLKLKGSPPHVRGKDAARKEKGLLRGITPACAGKSSMLSGAITSLLDHPRMCGEKF